MNHIEKFLRIKRDAFNPTFFPKKVVSNVVQTPTDTFSDPTGGHFNIAGNDKNPFNPTARHVPGGFDGGTDIGPHHPGFGPIVDDPYAGAHIFPGVHVPPPPPRGARFDPYGPPPPLMPNCNPNLGFGDDV